MKTIRKRYKIERKTEGEANKGRNNEEDRKREINEEVKKWRERQNGQIKIYKERGRDREIMCV